MEKLVKSVRHVEQFIKNTDNADLIDSYAHVVNAIGVAGEMLDERDEEIKELKSTMVKLWADLIEEKAEWSQHTDGAFRRGGTEVYDSVIGKLKNALRTPEEGSNNEEET